MKVDRDNWIDRAQAARILGLTVFGVRALQIRKRLTNYADVSNQSCYSRAEVEALARDPNRLRRQANTERSFAGRRLPDPNRIPIRLISMQETMEILGVKETMLHYLITTGQIISYQQCPRVSPHLFDPQDVVELRDRRARKKEERAEKLRISPPRQKRGKLASTKRLVGYEICEFERYFGEWLTARQAACMLQVSMPQIYRLRDQGRLPGRRQADYWYGGLRWQFLKSDVLALWNDAEHCRRRYCYEQHCSPEARVRRQKAEAQKQFDEVIQAMKEYTASKPVQDILASQW